MEKRPSLKHGIRKSNCVKKKKKLHQVLRKITDVQTSGSVKTNSSEIIDSRMETVSYNTLGKITDLLPQNSKRVDAKSVKGKSRIIIKHNNEAPPTKDVKCVNGKRKTFKKKTNACKMKSHVNGSVPEVGHLLSDLPQSLSLNERKKIDNDDLLSRKATLKQRKRNVKIIKKSVKKVIQSNSCNVEESFQENCVRYEVTNFFEKGCAGNSQVEPLNNNVVTCTSKSMNELQKDAQPNSHKNCKSFLQKSNLIKIDSSDISSCNGTLAQSDENIIGDEVGTTNCLGKRKKRGKLVQKKKSTSKCEQTTPCVAVGHKLLNKNNVKKVGEKEEIHSYTGSSLETSVKSLEEEIESSLENSLQMYSETNENSFGSMSSPICVEMHGKKNAPSNLFSKSIQSYQMHAAKRVVCEKEYFTWKQSNIPTSNQWKVRIGGVERLTPWNTHANQHEESVLEQKMTEGEYSEGNFMENREKISSDKTTFKLIKVSKTGVLMVLYPHQTVFFRGLCKLRVLWGTVDVLGYRIQDSSDQSYTIYSPWNFNMFGIHAHGEFPLEQEEYYNILEMKVLTKLPVPNEIDAAILRTFPMFSCFILWEQESNILPSFLNQYFPECFTPFGHKDICSKLLNVRFYNPQKLEESKTFKERKEWIDISNYFMKHHTDSRKIMVCGGKGVGKSSFLRFLINQMISSTKRILYIDLDPGQCEFTPPGCVSAVIVKKPLLGPNFTHLTDPERCIFIGRVDISKCPLQYMQSVELLLQWCTSEKNLHQIPWVINTMGFSQGVGVDLTIASIKLVCPTDVIQIQSSVRSRNFPFELKCIRVDKESVDSLISCKGIKVKYEFHSFLSAASSHTIKSPMLREIALLAYFSKTVEVSTLSLLSSSVHELPFKTLKLCICHEKVNYSFYLSAMNANVVGLCDVGDSHGLVPTDSSYPEIWTNTPISNCYGMGIVRGVDMESKKVYIVSPLPYWIIKKVNCLVLGAVYLPQKVYTLQNDVKGNIPYTTEGPGLAQMV